MSISNATPVSSALVSQMLQGSQRPSGAHGGGQTRSSSESSASLLMSALSSMNSLSSSASSGSMSTLSGLMNSIPGFSSGSSWGGTNILV